jgi:hypothetical protein
MSRIPAPTDIPIAFWSEPTSAPDLVYGVGGPELAPDPNMVYTLVKRDTRGYSTTLDLRDAAGRKWSAKLGPEARTEVVSSRIVWALGYMQPPSYYVPRLAVSLPDGTRDEGAARLRPSVEWLEPRGDWSWHKNPFVATPEFRGLLVLMMVLNSTDLKDANNVVYLARRESATPVLWYSVKDLGATLGDTGRFGPTRGDVVGFEKHGFLDDLRGESSPYVRFTFNGRHQELLRDLRPEDVAWTCERLAKLTDAQWRDAFAAGGYAPEITDRYVARIKAKIREGLALGALRRAS